MSVEPALLAVDKTRPPPKRGLPGRLARDGAIVFGAIVLLLMAIIGIAAPWLGTKNPSEINPAFRNRVPGIEQVIRNDDGTTRTFTYRMGTDSTIERTRRTTRGISGTMMATITLTKPARNSETSAIASRIAGIAISPSIRRITMASIQRM